jgi:arginine repressor
MTKVADIRQAIEMLATKGDRPSDLNDLVVFLRRHDDMSVASFLQMISRARAQPQAAMGATEAGAAQLVKSLQDAFGNDDTFRSELKRIQSDRRVTRESLNQIFETLSGRARKLPAKATKAKLAQDIADLRLERVRSERAAEMFKGKPIYAE